MKDAIPPQALEMEQSVLGAILIDNEYLEPVKAILQPSDFYRQFYRQTYKAMLDLSADGEPIDLLTVQNKLLAVGVEVEGTLAAHLYEVMKSTVTASNACYYAGVVRDKATLRRIDRLGSMLRDLAQSEDEDIETVTAKVEDLVTRAIANRTGESNTESLKDILSRVYDDLEEKAQNPTMVSGVPTGIATLDYYTRGWQRSNLVVIGARPSQGKTALGAFFAIEAAKRGYPTLIISQEMSKDAMGLRLLQAYAKVDGHTLRIGRLSDDDWIKTTQACGQMSTYPLWVSERPMTLEQVRSECRKYARKGLRLAVVDYLQIMKAEGRSKTEEVSLLAQGLADLSVELKITLICLSQFSREQDKRPGNRPQLSDLRDSGQVEAAADLVILPFNEAAFGNNERQELEPVELIVAKQRDGMVGSARALFVRRSATFADIAKERDEPPPQMPYREDNDDD